MLTVPGVGEVNKIVFTNPSMEKAFGVPKQSDPEGARDLTMMWQEHAPNPHDVPGEYHQTAPDHVDELSTMYMHRAASLFLFAPFWRYRGLQAAEWSTRG